MRLPVEGSESASLDFGRPYSSLIPHGWGVRHIILARLLKPLKRSAMGLFPKQYSTEVFRCRTRTP